MDVRFLSPTSGQTLTAEVDPTLTAKDALDSLIGCNFLVPAGASRSYSLVAPRSGRVMLPGETLADAGVGPNDVVEVAQASEAAGGASCLA